MHLDEVWLITAEQREVFLIPVLHDVGITYTKTYSTTDKWMEKHKSITLRFIS